MESVRVLIYSNGTNEKYASIFKDVLSYNSKIPRGVMDSLYITLESDERYRVPKKYINEDFMKDTIEDQLRRIGVHERVTVVEVLVDLDLAYEQIAEEANRILDRASGSS